MSIGCPSNRSKRAAKKAWENLKKRHGDILGSYKAVLRRVDLGAGKGVFFRIIAGPLADARAADTLCRELRVRKLYCTISS